VKAKIHDGVPSLTTSRSTAQVEPDTCEKLDVTTAALAVVRLKHAQRSTIAQRSIVQLPIDHAENRSTPLQPSAFLFLDGNCLRSARFYQYIQPQANPFSAGKGKP
jgi:cAMP phosphodiesterase